MTAEVCLSLLLEYMTGISLLTIVYYIHVSSASAYYLSIIFFSVYWDYAMTIRLEEIVYLHCHQQGKVSRDLHTAV